MNLLYKEKSKDENNFNNSEYIKNLLNDTNNINNNLLKILYDNFIYKISKKANVKLYYKSYFGFIQIYH